MKDFKNSCISIEIFSPWYKRNCLWIYMQKAAHSTLQNCRSKRQGIQKAQWRLTQRKGSLSILLIQRTNFGFTAKHQQGPFLSSFWKTKLRTNMMTTTPFPFVFRPLLIYNSAPKFHHYQSSQKLEQSFLHDGYYIFQKKQHF